MLSAKSERRKGAPDPLQTAWQQARAGQNTCWWREFQSSSLPVTAQAPTTHDDKRSNWTSVYIKDENTTRATWTKSPLNPMAFWHCDKMKTAQEQQHLFKSKTYVQSNGSISTWAARSWRRESLNNDLTFQSIKRVIEWSISIKEINISDRVKSVRCSE